MHYSFGLGASSLGHRRREEFPAVFYFTGHSTFSYSNRQKRSGIRMRELSIFIDESGDFGDVTERPAYYLVTLLFHEQEQSIAEQIRCLEESTQASGFQLDYIHTGPVIRREEIFRHYSIDERRKLLYKMLNFVNACPVRYTTIIVNKHETPDKISLSGKLARKIRDVIENHMDYFLSFDKVIVYYDYGQIELSAILNAVFSVYFNSLEFRKAEPQKYRLLQAADFICSIELLKLKREEHRLSKSEEKFFYKPQELKKTFIKTIEKKKL